MFEQHANEGKSALAENVQVYLGVTVKSYLAAWKWVPASASGAAALKDTARHRLVLRP